MADGRAVPKKQLVYTPVLFVVGFLTCNYVISLELPLPHQARTLGTSVVKQCSLKEGSTDFV